MSHRLSEGPGGIEVAERRVVAIGVDLDRRLGVEIDEPQVHPLVDTGDLLAIGREARRVEEGWRRAERDLRHRPEAVGGADVECVFAALVREVGDRFAVGRPRGIAVGDAGALGERTHVALLGGNRQDLAVRLEKHALAGGRERGMENVGAFELLEARTQLRQVGRDRDRNPAVLHRREIEHVKRVELVVDDRARPGRRRLNVEPVTVLDRRRDRVRDACRRRKA